MVNFIPPYNINKIAQILGLDMSDLLMAPFSTPSQKAFENRKIKENRDREISLIEKFRSVDDRGKHTIETVTEMEYTRCNKSHLTPMAAHNDYAEDEEEQRLIQEDLENL